MFEKCGIEHLERGSFWDIFLGQNLIKLNIVRKEVTSQMERTSFVMPGTVRSPI